jgi:DNA mismatch repair protein MutL
MTQRIVHILPEQVASQIAAGEVVERPASALKELVENALDAGARNISVELERGGAGLIAVADDGCGMGREDAILALRRHATSKIRDAADLAAIRTLGFRGEALAAIASVARMVLRTRRLADDHGIEIVATGGEIERVEACAMAPGTRIEVRELFFNTPARLKFLKTVATEQGAAAEAIQRLALANFSVAFALAADGRKLATTPRAISLLERLRQLLGAKMADQMIAFDHRAGHALAWGLAATSQESFATARMVFTFVNGRAVRDRILARAIAQAYQSLLPRGRHPAVALMVELRPEEVDVNVHPMKTEVRFRNSGALFELVYHALRARLADQTASGGDYQTASDGALHTADRGEQESSAAGDGLRLAPVAVAGNEAASSPDAAPAPADAYGDRPLRLVADAPAVRIEQRALGLGYGGAPRAAIAEAEFAGAAAGPGAAAGAALDGAAPAAHGMRAAPIPRYSELRVMGQLFAGYIALEDSSSMADDGLILVDQHAAHERVTFERLRDEMRTGGVRTQALLSPVPLELGLGRAALVIAGLAELRAIGFELEQFGPSTLLLKAVPAVFGANGDGLRLLADVIEGMGEAGGRSRGAHEVNAIEDLLKRLACHGSVRVGRMLAADEITALLVALDATPFKTNCPHGRPVHIRFARGAIERLFRR